MAGTGLGLPISKHFAEAHGGQVWLESEVGVGTTAHLILQLEPHEEPVVVATRAES
jgi:signal transduction histidine kinase